jgi:hypothetical protein
VERHGKGYPDFAAFMDSDDAFLIFRRFGYVQCRLLLQKQDELRTLEEQLDDMDDEGRYGDFETIYTRQAQGEARRNLLRELEAKYLEYGQFLLRASS